MNEDYQTEETEENEVKFTLEELNKLVEIAYKQGYNDCLEGKNLMLGTSPDCYDNGNEKQTYD